MCGRYILINGQKIFATWETMRKLDTQGIPYLTLKPNYNVAPSTINPIVIRENGLTKLVYAKWGFNWQLLDKTSGELKNIFTINVKSETVTKSKLFSKSFREHRCLVPADGFYEWKQIKSKNKQPMLIRMKNDTPFMMAGIYRFEKDAEKNEQLVYTIITTTPNELLADIHNRMPVIIDSNDYEQWLDEDIQEPKSLLQFLIQYPASKMKFYPVSPEVGNTRNNHPDLLKEVSYKCT